VSEKPTPESRRSLLLLPPPFVVVNVAVGRPLAASLDSTSSRNCHSTSSSRPGLADVLSSLCVDRCSVTRQTQTNNRKRFLISYPRRQQWRGHNVRLCLCLLFHTMSQKPMQLGSRNLTRHGPQSVLKAHLFCGQQVKGQGHEAQKHYWRGSC